MKNNQELSKEDKGLLFALSLGDGCLRKPHPQTGSVQLEIGHSTKQEEYCVWKRDLVYSICGGTKEPKIGYRTIKLKNSDNEYYACRFTKIHEYFIHLRKKLYPNGRKIITRELLDMLDLQGIAIWFMDDGSCYKKDNEAGTKSIMFDLRIGTDCFTKEENELIVEYFKEVWDISFYVYYKKKENSWIIRARKNAALAFIELIKPYIIPSMSYKIEYKEGLHECETSLQKDEDIV